MLPSSRALVLAFFVAGCVTAPAPAPPATQPATPPSERPTPAYLTTERGCAVLAGGAIGSDFDDKQMASFWQKVNASVTSELHTRLTERNVRVVKLLVPTEQVREVEQIVVRGAAQNRCNRLLQIAHTVAEDNAGRYFRFDVALMRFQPKGERPAGATSTPVVMVGEFSQQYRFPRTKESFDNFYTGTFAERVLGDLEKSGALAPLR